MTYVQAETYPVGVSLRYQAVHGLQQLGFIGVEPRFLHEAEMGQTMCHLLPI